MRKAEIYYGSRRRRDEHAARQKADVYSTGVGEAAEQARAGKVRVLAITAPERMKGDTVKDFPTLKEQGIDDEFTVWRGFMGPPGMSKSAVKYYEEKSKR